MAYRQTIEDGKGNVIEEKILYSLKDYKKRLKVELKEIWRQKWPPIEKQLNLLHGFIEEPEASQLKKLMLFLTKEYSNKRALIDSAKTLEEAHSVIHG